MKPAKRQADIKELINKVKGKNEILTVYYALDGNFWTAQIHTKEITILHTLVGDMLSYTESAIDIKNIVLAHTDINQDHMDKYKQEAKVLFIQHEAKKLSDTIERLGLKLLYDFSYDKLRILDKNVGVYEDDSNEEVTKVPASVKKNHTHSAKHNINHIQTLPLKFYWFNGEHMTIKE